MDALGWDGPLDVRRKMVGSAFCRIAYHWGVDKTQSDPGARPSTVIPHGDFVELLFRLSLAWSLRNSCGEKSIHWVHHEN